MIEIIDFLSLPFIFRLTLTSDPYVRIDLNTVDGDINLDSVLTKTKKKVFKVAQHLRNFVIKTKNPFIFADAESCMERRVHFQGEGGRAQAGAAGVR